VGGHVGIPEADDLQDKLLHGDICGTVVIWQRLLAMISYMDSSFPNGFDGPGDLSITDPDPRGDIMKTQIASPALRSGSGTAPEQPVLKCRRGGPIRRSTWGEAAFPLEQTISECRQAASRKDIPGAPGMTNANRGTAVAFKICRKRRIDHGQWQVG
jgi:hypothetical protein